MVQRGQNQVPRCCLVFWFCPRRGGHFSGTPTPSAYSVESESWGAMFCAASDNAGRGGRGATRGGQGATRGATSNVVLNATTDVQDATIATIKTTINHTTISQRSDQDHHCQQQHENISSHIICTTAKTIQLPAGRRLAKSHMG